MKVKDPVCGMTIEDSNAASVSSYKGTTYYYCSSSCIENIDKDPKAYICAKARPAFKTGEQNPEICSPVPYTPKCASLDRKHTPSVAWRSNLSHHLHLLLCGHQLQLRIGHRRHSETEKDGTLRRIRGGNIKAVLTIIIGATLFSLSACTKQESPLPVVGNKAPLFALKDTGGKTVKLSDFSGKVVTIDFWATWCGPCRESTAELEKLYRKYKDRGVVILGISMDSGGGAVQKVKDYAEKNNLTYQMLMDDGKASVSYSVYNIPATYILDRNHVIVKIYKGYMTGLGDSIAGQIEKLL